MKKMSNEKKVHQGVLQYFGVTWRHSTNLLRVNPTRAVAKEQEYAIFYFLFFSSTLYRDFSTI